MATAIPSSMTFEMLSRLPANSFVIQWKEIRPDQTPVGNRYDIGAASQTIRFNIRGAPNEFLMNTNMYVCGSAYIDVVAGDLTNAAGVRPAQVGGMRSQPSTYLKQSINFFQGSRESFNSGSLPYLDNQDQRASFEQNYIRSLSARRTINPVNGIVDDLSAVRIPLGGNNFSTISTGEDQRTGSAVRLVAFRYNLDAADSNAGAISTTHLGKDRNFRIPLGYYSNLVNSHSVIPIGLMTSYAVNGWQIDLNTSTQSANDGRVFYSLGATDLYDVLINNTAVAPNSFVVAANRAVTPKAYLRDVRIFAPIIKVLDPAVMEAVLSLYEKREMVNVGGVQFPLSLRMNSIAYRYSNFALQQGQQGYYFRVTGTDRSVRALAWKIYSRTYNNLGVATMNGATDVACVNRLEVSIGSEKICDVVEDVAPNTQNINNFIEVSANRSACLFSPFPYYQEGRKFDGQMETIWSDYNNSINPTVFQTKSPSVVNPTTGSTVATNVASYRNGLSIGYVSLENLDRRESDYSGSFQASGKDLTAVGAIELRMSISKPLLAATTSLATFNGSTGADSLMSWAPIDSADLAIVFCYAYDSVLEISPSGVIDITNAVL